MRWATSTASRVIVLASWVGLAACASAERDLPLEPAASTPSALISIPHARVPLDGVLTGGQPTPEQLTQAAEAGYRTVVNLRGEDEEGYEWEADRAAELGLRYLQIPIADADDLVRENAETLARLLEDEDARPMVVHCRSGNRVGALLALKAAWVDGAPVDQALALGLDGGLTKLEAKTRELLGAETD